MNPNKASLKTVRTFGVVLLLTILACSAAIPVARYKLLTESTSSLTAVTVDTYTRIEKLQRLFAIATAPDTTISRNTFSPRVAGESFDLVPVLRFRETAVDVLFHYMKVLYAIASKNYVEEVTVETQRLGASLRGLLDCSTAMPAADKTTTAGIFATLLNQLSREWIGRNQMRALKTAMDLAQDDIDKLSGLVARSNVKLKTALDLMLDRIIAHANATRPEYFSINRLSFDREVADVIAEVDAIEQSLDSMSQAWSKIARAHRETRRALDQKQTTYKSLQELVKEVQQMRTFYRNLTQ